MMKCILVLSWERSLLFEAVNELEAVHSQEERQLALNLVVSHAILSINENYRVPAETDIGPIQSADRLSASDDDSAGHLSFFY